MTVQSLCGAVSADGHGHCRLPFRHAGAHQAQRMHRTRQGWQPDQTWLWTDHEGTRP